MVEHGDTAVTVMYTGRDSSIGAQEEGVSQHQTSSRAKLRLKLFRVFRGFERLRLAMTSEAQTCIWPQVVFDTSLCNDVDR